MSKRREVLIHLNIELLRGDQRSVEEIVTAISGALEVGSDDDSVRGLKIEIPLAEEV